jgi:hypothetical protein
MEVKVLYQGYFAEYKVLPEQGNLYLAELIHYDGSMEYNPPPSTLLLIKGIRRWLGSFDQPDFLNDIGSVIESRMKSEDYINYTGHNLSL